MSEEQLPANLTDRLKANLRTLSWLDAGRVRVYAAMILVAYLPMMVKVYREATGTVGSDFLAFWGAGGELIVPPFFFKMWVRGGGGSIFGQIILLNLSRGVISCSSIYYF